MAAKLADLRVKLFTDGADKAQILEMAQKPWIAGFTTNPSLLRKAGVTDYEAYGRDITAAVPDRHISFEVFSDDIPEMVAQARLITHWGKNVYVKLPVTNTRGEPLTEAIRTLSADGVKVNVTAIFSPPSCRLRYRRVCGRRSRHGATQRHRSLGLFWRGASIRRSLLRVFHPPSRCRC